MKVLFISSEVVPFAKTGGLADVSGSLPVWLKQHNNDVCVITPLYRTTMKCFRQDLKRIDTFDIGIGDNVYNGEIWQGRLKSSVPVFFIRCDTFFDRDRLYGNDMGDFTDNAERFIFFCRSVFVCCLKTGFLPDILHCNDWQTGLVPAYLKTLYSGNDFSSTATVFTVHNIAYQGIFEQKKFSLTGIPDAFFTPDGLEYWGDMCLLKAGFIYADVINTVSKKYSKEIQTPELGFGMEGVLASRKGKLFGILNGVDYEAWDPLHDTLIAAQYSKKSIRRKHLCKEALVHDVKLPDIRIDKPLIGCISRLADQKGFDLLNDIFEELMDLDIGFVLLGTGDLRYHDVFKALGNKYDKQVRIILAYDNVLAHKIEAGCDMFLMPSRYEPCGLNQIYSLRYGTIPIVRATGGLDDTIVHYDKETQQGTGFKFHHYSAAALLQAVKEAVEMYNIPEKWKMLVQNAMSCDFSWEKSAQQYVALYKRALEHKRG